MASFFEELWSSVLTPGPTPSLLIATNASFACLQFLLLCLLLATYSLHFMVLSFLCGGLWWSVNWFAAELRSAKASESSEDPSQDEDGYESQRIPLGDSDTETEPTMGSMKIPPPRKAFNMLEPRSPETGDALRKRRSMGESSGYISTDSEWEKISQNSERDR